MAIYILEDELVQAKFLQDFINSYFLQVKQPIPIYHYFRPTDLLHNIDLSSHNLYLLDIQIKSDLTSGLETAKAIRNYDKKGEIAFITSHQELAIEALQTMVSPIMFIQKNTDARSFNNQLIQVLEHYLYVDQPNEELLFILKTNEAYLSEPFNDIVYFEVTGNHQITLTTKRKIFNFYGTLKEIESQQNGLIRTHQAFLVNPENIRQFDRRNKVLEMVTGDKIPVTRTFLKQITEWFEGLAN